VEEPLIEISVDLPAEFIMELLPSAPAIMVPLFLILPDTYDSLQIFFTTDRFTGDQVSYGAEYNRSSLQR